MVGAAFVFGIAQLSEPGQSIGPPLLIGGMLVFLGGALYGLLAARMVSPRKIDNDFIWVKGVCPEYLAELPPWPGAAP